MLPNDVLLFSDAQYSEQTGDERAARVATGSRSVRSIGKDRVVAGLVAARQAFQISSDQPAVFLLQRPAAFHADSNGCAAGNTLEEAIVQGFLELVERDAYAIWWYNRLQRAEVDLEPVRQFLCPRSAEPSSPKPDASSGCSTSPAISAFRPMWRSCTGCRTARRISSSVPARISTAASPCCAR